MENKRDYYEVLGLNKNATEAEIKKNFRKLSKQYHPDKMVGKSEKETKDAEEKFKEINEAYTVLSDKEKKQLYDQFGHDMGRSQAGGYGNMNQDDLQDFINRMHRQSGFDPFNPFGRDQQAQEPQPITVNVTLTLEEIYSGTKKTFKYNVNRKCKHCEGKKYVESEGGKVESCRKCNGVGTIHEQHGNMMFMSTCNHCMGTGKIITNGCKHCGGTGYEKSTETIEIEFPKGIGTNQGIEFNGKGNEVLINGKSIIGSLIVIVREKQHNVFERDGSNIHCILEPSVYDSLLGENVSVKSIDGKEHKFKLNVGTETGEIFRLGGLGMPIMNTNKFGDLLVHIKNKMPKKLTNEEITLLKKLKNGK